MLAVEWNLDFFVLVLLPSFNFLVQYYFSADLEETGSSSHWLTEFI